MRHHLRSAVENTCMDPQVLIQLVVIVPTFPDSGILSSLSHCKEVQEVYHKMRMFLQF